MCELTEPGVAPLDRALELCARLAALPPLAVKVTNQVVDVMAEASRGAGLALERLAYGMLAQTDDSQHAIAERLR